MRLRALLAVATCMACLPAAALLTRADREDAEYLELATRYPASVRLPALAGEGVRIAQAPGADGRGAGINTVDIVSDRTFTVRIKAGDDASDLTRSDVS